MSKHTIRAVYTQERLNKVNVTCVHIAYATDKNKKD